MKQNTAQSFEGSGLKFLFEIVAPGFSMHNDDFSVILKQGPTEKEIPKSEFIEETTTENGNETHKFYLCFDSSIFHAGIVNCIVKAFVPDTDFQGGTRLEIDKFDIVIINPV